MKKGILFIALFAASFGFMQSSFAAPSMSANSITNVLAISDYEGTYSGTMDNIIMRGKPYESRAATYKIEGGRLKCDFPQIGSMPGTITISLAVEVDERDYSLQRGRSRHFVASVGNKGQIVFGRLERCKDYG